MVSICFYFQVHQPFRIRKYSVFNIGNISDYFDDFSENEKLNNIRVLRKISEKCYLPMNRLLLDLIKKYPNFKICFSFSGVFLEQLERYAPDVLESFQELVKTGKVEILSETYFHSLSFLYSKKEFKKQVLMHQKKIYNLFKKKPSVFRNTELIFNNDLANYIESLGYKGIITEGADRVLEWRSPNFLYYPKNTKKIKLLLKNYKLSDDIAFRFSQQSWSEWPLDVKKYCQWVNSINGNGNLVNLFMDYETFGEHQWKDTGIFEFIKHLPEEFLKNPDNNFVTPSEAIKKYDAVAELDIPHYISWADLERDTSAWNGNSMQQSALKSAYKIEKLVLSTGNKNLIDSWRKLQTSDHFYYMCTKWYSDGDIHKYFNPYESPYDAYISFMNVLKDIKIRAYNDLRSRKSNVYKQNSTILNKEAITQS